MHKFLLIVLLFSCSLNGFSQNKELILGKWLTAAGDAHVQIYPNGNKFSGKLVWLKDPLDDNGKPRLDKENPKNELTKRPILGMIFLYDFIFKDGIWEGGTIYDPKTGKTYSCKISSEGKDKINVRGFVGFSLLGRTETWTRVL
jgi:uncharacterized protein (DUF2147 family)